MILYLLYEGLVTNEVPKIPEMKKQIREGGGHLLIMMAYYLLLFGDRSANDNLQAANSRLPN